MGLANLGSLADTEPFVIANAAPGADPHCTGSRDGADGGERAMLNPSDVSRCAAALALVGLRLCSAKSYAGERSASALASARRCASAGFPHLR